MLISRFSKWASVIAYLILGGFLISCGEGTSPVGNFVDPNLTQAQWMLATINDKPAATGSKAMLVFDESNNVFGSTGCNLYSGPYLLGEGNALSFTPRVTTSWECEENSFAQQAALLLVLSSASDYVIEGDELKIINLEGDRRATFTKKAPLDLSGTDWSLDALNEGQVGLGNLIEATHITAVFNSDGTLSGSGGCNEYNTIYTADASNLSVEPVVSTRMECPEPEGVMDQEANYFVALEKMSTYRNYGIALEIFDAEGNLLTTFLSSRLASQR